MIPVNSPIIIQKTPVGEWDVTIDWAKPERELGDDLINTSTWEVRGADDLLIVSDEEISTDKISTTAWFSAGTIPNYYTVTNTVVTVGGRTLTQTFLFYMVPYIFITQPSCI